MCVSIFYFWTIIIVNYMYIYLLVIHSYNITIKITRLFIIIIFLMSCWISFANSLLRFNFFKIVFMWPFKRSLLNLLQYCFCFMFCIFGCEACGILVPWSGIEAVVPALEGEVSTPGPPTKSQGLFWIHF